MAFLRRQVVTAALTANAIRPGARLPRRHPVVLRRLADHRARAAPAGAHRRRHRRARRLTPPRRRSRPGWRSPRLNLAGQAFLHRPGPPGAAQDAEDALVEGLGYDYVEQLDAKPTPAELATPWRRLVNPFRMRDVDVVGREEHRLRARARQARPARHLPARRRRPIETRPGAAPGARRRAGRSATRTSRASR